MTPRGITDAKPPTHPAAACAASPHPSPPLAPDNLCFEEVSYTMFTLAQLLGFMEVCRREGPRERNFLDEGSLAGSDTLFTLLEGMR